MSSSRPVAETTAVITCYNHQAYVEQCLDSIASQSVLPRRVIVFDDESTDDSVAVIRHWIKQNDLDATLVRTGSNVGVCAVMNRALALVETPFYFHLAADDWAGIDRVGIQTRTLENAGDDIAFVAGDFVEVDAGGLTLATYDVRERLEGMTGFAAHETLHRRLLSHNFVPAPAVMVATDAVRQIGGYDESLAFEDYDLWLRLSAKYGVEYSPCLAATYRVVPSSLSRRSDRALSLLDSEVRLLSKHRGDAQNDVIIRDRLALLEMAREELITSSADTAPGESTAGRRRLGRGRRRRATSRSAN